MKSIIPIKYILQPTIFPILLMINLCYFLIFPIHFEKLLKNLHFDFLKYHLLSICYWKMGVDLMIEALFNTKECIKYLLSRKIFKLKHMQIK